MCCLVDVWCLLLLSLSQTILLFLKCLFFVLNYTFSGLYCYHQVCCMSTVIAIMLCTQMLLPLNVSLLLVVVHFPPNTVLSSEACPQLKSSVACWGTHVKTCTYSLTAGFSVTLFTSVLEFFKLPYSIPICSLVLVFINYVWNIV